MNIFDAQALLANAGLYSFGIDGAIGPKTLQAVRGVLGTTGTSWPDERRVIGAAQKLLNAMDFEAGSVDGFVGHNTDNALAAWRYFQIHGKREVVERTSLARATSGQIPHQNDVEAFYGTPGADIERQLAYAVLPFGMRLDWNLGETITRFRLHEKCIDPFYNALTEVYDQYGMSRMRALGIDRYAGGHMHRKMRGGSKWSMHAYGCAVDFFARPNGLRARCPQALFCGSDYKPFLDIMESHGWLPAVRLWGADAMHFQMARL